MPSPRHPSRSKPPAYQILLVAEFVRNYRLSETVIGTAPNLRACEDEVARLAPALDLHALPSDAPPESDTIRTIMRALSLQWPGVSFRLVTRPL